MRILVTGVTGYIGGRLVRGWSRTGIRFASWSATPAASPGVPGPTTSSWRSGTSRPPPRCALPAPTWTWPTTSSPTSSSSPRWSAGSPARRSPPPDQGPGSRIWATGRLPGSAPARSCHGDLSRRSRRRSRKPRAKPGPLPRPLLSRRSRRRPVTAKREAKPEAGSVPVPVPVPVPETTLDEKAASLDRASEMPGPEPALFLMSRRPTPPAPHTLSSFRVCTARRQRRANFFAVRRRPTGPEVPRRRATPDVPGHRWT